MALQLVWGALLLFTTAVREGQEGEGDSRSLSKGLGSLSALTQSLSLPMHGALGLRIEALVGAGRCIPGQGIVEQGRTSSVEALTDSALSGLLQSRIL